MAKRVVVRKAPFHERSPLLLLAIATALALLPFVNKAFTMDDPLFGWSAQWIADHPLDPYGFALNWYGRTQPMREVMQNPPLTSYALAAAATVTGWNEPTLHVVFGLFAFAAVAGTWSLARRMTERPLLAALLTLAMPFFLVSATNVMSDVPMLACFVWALALWRRGLDENRDPLLWRPAHPPAAAGGVAAAAALEQAGAAGAAGRGVRRLRPGHARDHGRGAVRERLAHARVREDAGDAQLHRRRDDRAALLRAADEARRAPPPRRGGGGGGARDRQWRAGTVHDLC